MLGETRPFMGPPSPGIIADGINHVASQFLALGLSYSSASYFLSQSSGSPTAHNDENFLLNHIRVYPPLDRMSCISYWWGYELLFPEPSMVYLAHADQPLSTFWLHLQCSTEPCARPCLLSAMLHNLWIRNGR
ncbi:hypothetical protein BS47DRAFT_105315 [Hydnum rufescens UP504]|uniref:Uncharacterized protein n=1 Tax=Hydnum rufescens UP504 TaxID=1448309 RepID=A0A9P6AQX2_9AGAM|nr:hypothetical protein BS47DRAFT_105315 [Hydnum rufescens UP504]